MRQYCVIFLLSILVVPYSIAQHQHAEHGATAVTGLEPQPFLAHAIRLQEALSFLGSSLSAEDAKRLQALRDKPLNEATVKSIQEILDPYCLASIAINPEARVKVERGAAAAHLMQGGWTSFLVKVQNDAGITPRLEVESPNSATPLFAPTQDSRVQEEKKLTAGQVANRFLEMEIYRQRPMMPNLSGLKLEYAVLQLYSKDSGQREVELGFNIGQGTQDIGFRNTINILFTIRPSVKVNLHIQDDDGSPTMGSFLITDGIDHMNGDSAHVNSGEDFRRSAAQIEHGTWARQFAVAPSLRGIYPLPSRRVAAYDEYPDFFFQPQIYRADGEHVQLPPGKYQVRFTRGPEYVTQVRDLVVPAGVTSVNENFHLKRWINLAQLGWHSADHHVHGGGCSHYESPEEGVPPRDMWRQALGEDLNIAAVLAWGPSWYHQKTFFTGKDDPLSTSKNIMRADVEVSGFPSSHAGHVVLLRLKEDDYPGTTKIEEWPSWTLPVLSWAKSQGGVVGYAHSGWGLEPLEPTTELPNYVIPKMDGIGANEYIVTVTHNVIDFFSAGDTPIPWEMNMWYHTLNCGFKTRISGETDFPCIYDERVGIARSYYKAESALNYDNYVAALQKGRSYVSDGFSHIIDFAVNGVEPGTKNSEVNLDRPQNIAINAKVTAMLAEHQDEIGAAIANRLPWQAPYWHIERARIGSSRKVRVEVLVNGTPVDTTELIADGKWNDVRFTVGLQRSSWVALRILGSAHTNPVFVTVAGKPIRERRSAEWCRQAVDQCWKMKESQIRASEQAAASAAYDQARQTYDRIIKESPTQ